MSLGPHVGLRVFEWSKRAFVDVALNLESATAAPNCVNLVEDDDGEQSGTINLVVAIFVLIVRQGEPTDAATVAAMIKKLEPSPYLVVFCIDCEAPISIFDVMPTAALFTSENFDDLEILIRQIRSPPNLIGIDLGDMFSVWSGRISVLHTLRAEEVAEAASAVEPIDGLFLSFPNGMSLQEIEQVVADEGNILPSAIDLVWRDGGKQPHGMIDVCFTRRAALTESRGNAHAQGDR